jgi:hypothetical protein
MANSNSLGTPAHRAFSGTRCSRAPARCLGRLYAFATRCFAVFVGSRGCC